MAAKFPQRSLQVAFRSDPKYNSSGKAIAKTTANQPTCGPAPRSSFQTAADTPESIVRAPYGAGMRVVWRSTICQLLPFFTHTCSICNGVSPLAPCAVTLARIVAALP